MSSVSDTAWYLSWALTPQERLRLRCILDAVVAELYGLDVTDFAWILRDCDHPVAQATNNAFARVLDPKGFWRVDKAQPPERRHTVLAQVAFQELKKLGLDAFLALNNGDGWMLPDTLCLADYGLGHDERARTPQPVVAALGPRFLDWQLAISPEDSWAACRRHADNIRRIRAVGIDQSPVGSGREVRDGEVAYGEPGKTEPSETEPASPPSPAAAGPATDLLGNSIDTDLFGAPIKTDKRRRK